MALDSMHNRHSLLSNATARTHTEAAAEKLRHVSSSKRVKMVIDADETVVQEGMQAGVDNGTTTCAASTCLLMVVGAQLLSPDPIVALHAIKQTVLRPGNDVKLEREPFCVAVRAELLRNGVKADEYTVNLLFDTFDEDDSGTVDFTEFMLGLGKLVHGSVTEKLSLMYVACS